MKSCTQSDGDVVFSVLPVLCFSAVGYVIRLYAVPSPLGLRLQGPEYFIDVFCPALSERYGVAAFN